MFESGCLSLPGTWEEGLCTGTYLHCLYFLTIAVWEFTFVLSETISLHCSSHSSELCKASAGGGSSLWCMVWNRRFCPMNEQVWYPDSHFGSLTSLTQHRDKMSLFIWAVRFRAIAGEWLEPSAVTKAAYFIPLLSVWISVVGWIKKHKTQSSCITCLYILSLL